MTYHRTIQGAGRGVYGLYFGNPIMIGLGVPSEYLRIDGYSMDCEPVSKKKRAPRRRTVEGLGNMRSGFPPHGFDVA